MERMGVVAFAFGVPSTIKSNISIAGIASKYARKFDIPIYTQRDIIPNIGVEVKYVEEEIDKPPPTLRIARGAVMWAKQYKITLLWIVAAKPHLWRVLRDLDRAVDEAGIPQIRICICDEISNSSEDYWFCPESSQERVRSRKIWNKRERILKLMPFFIYKRIAN